MNLIYNRFLYNLGNKAIDLDGDTFKIALLADTYTPNKDHNVFSDVSANEVSGDGYTAGGETLGSLSLTEDDSNDRAAWDAANTLFVGVTVTARYAVIYDTTVSDNLVCLFDFGSNQTVTAGNLQLTYNSSGLILFQQG